MVLEFSKNTKNEHNYSQIGPYMSQNHTARFNEECLRWSWVEPVQTKRDSGSDSSGHLLHATLLSLSSPLLLLWSALLSSLFSMLFYLTLLYFYCTLLCSALLPTLFLSALCSTVSYFALLCSVLLALLEFSLTYSSLLYTILFCCTLLCSTLLCSTLL